MIFGSYGGEDDTLAMAADCAEEVRGEAGGAGGRGGGGGSEGSGGAEGCWVGDGGGEVEGAEDDWAELAEEEGDEELHQGGGGEGGEGRGGVERGV